MESGSRADVGSADRFVVQQRFAIAFEPLEKDVEKGIGTAVVDLESGRLLRLTSKPSKFPIYLSQMDIRMEFADSVCGQAKVHGD